MTRINGNKALAWPCRGIESPWWRRNSNWNCQGISLLSKLTFLPWIRWQIRNVYCLEHDRWQLQCFLLRDQRCNRRQFTVMNIYFTASVTYGSSLPLIPPSLSFSDCAVTLALSLFLRTNFCLPMFCPKTKKTKKTGKNQLNRRYLTWNQLSALTPPPERFGQLLKWIRLTLNLQIGILPLTS